MLKLSEDIWGDADAPALPSAFIAVRAHSQSLAAPLSEEDCQAQSMPDASPVKWHLAHTSWFFETFILERFEADFRAFNPAFRMLFNSYYNGIGDKFTRAQRGLLTRPALAEVLAYRKNVDRRIVALLKHRPAEPEIAELVALGLQHEQQHQELIVTDAKHLLAVNPVQPEYGLDFDISASPPETLQWHRFPAAVVEIGHAGGGFCFDNETPRHRQFLESFSLASRLVTNAEFSAFIEDGGYEKSEYWLSEGWDWVQANAVTHPLYWQRDGNAWRRFTLRGTQPLQPDHTALHISYFEAAAYALWAGARLPTEAEWEAAATSGQPFQQMFGSAWQWTSSAYAAYPGFAPATGAVGEYNGKFMVNQYVLRGSSAATPEGHSRATYRNFFPAGTRWQFSGIRLAR
jgi:ergothioneine biosynthesis protein EgtB